MSFEQKQHRIDQMTSGDEFSNCLAYASLEGENDIVLDGHFNLDDLKKIVAIMESQK